MSTNPFYPKEPDPTVDFGNEELADQMVHILDHYLAELKAGRKPDRAALLAKHPHLANQLAACLAGLEFIQGVESTNKANAGRTTGNLAPQRLLGDFRILNEVGRGGMGVVYEAEQMSLGRRVALKVLRFGGVSDPEALDRFKREAETVAGLHHTNIVPIFAVGSDQGVNFFAMQFIQGRSLSEVLSGSNEPLDAMQVMQWGLQAAEALTHAHERNVIHRDVKPSNLLLDQEGRIWLTDFGLARRLDDVTMSRTGAMLGTPRYMSPEQASASRQQVDRRTDVYSLGATLYELLAGQPVFQGDTAHRVIQQILSSEPTPLRRLRPKLPRDLETVVMKCLNKNSEDRYHSARALADDLRACIDQRPIRARRAGWTEQAVRWLRGRQEGVRISSYAVGATLLLVTLLAIGWSWYQASRRVNVLLTTKTPPLSAEFIDSRGDSVVTVSVPTERPVVMQDGEYELRVSSPDRWSQTFATTVQHGDPFKLEMDLEDQQLWSPTTTLRWWSLVDDTESASLLLWSDEGVACESGVPKKRRWRKSFKEGKSAAMDGAPGLLWPWFKGPESAHHLNGATRHAPVAASKTLDVNGDGQADFIVAAHHQAFVMTLSGLDGSVLWCAAQGEDVRKQPIARQETNPRSICSTIVGSPIITGDQDADGVEDVLVTCADAGTESLVPMLVASGGGSVVDARRWVELLSGATGKSIWRHDLENKSFQLLPEERVPTEFQWIVGTGYGTSSSDIGGSWNLKRHSVRWGRNQMSVNGMHAYLPEPASLVQVQGKAMVAVVAGKRIEWLDLKSGEPIVVSDSQAMPGCSGRWVDMNGDGEPEFTFLERVSASGKVGAFRADDTAKVIVWKVRDQQALWTTELQAKFPIVQSLAVSPPNWPLIDDLDQDGRPEVIVPDTASSITAGSFGAVPWGELAVIDGKNGQSRWRQKIVNVDQQVDRFSVGPDIDGDGYRELFVASLANRPTRLYVEARSGKSGESLWITPSVIRSDARLQDRLVGPLQWWNAGEDGWPQLIVTVQGEITTPLESDGLIYSALTGRMTRMRRQVGEIQSMDVDHDGVADLVTYHASEQTHPEDGGTIDCLRGVVAEPWNRLGSEGAPSADFNGDGIRDILRTDFSGGLAVICGRLGTKIWETNVGSHYAYTARALVEPHASQFSSLESAPSSRDGDINGDGIVDILFWPTNQFGKTTSMIGTVSGKTGKVIWRSSELTVRISEGIVDYRIADLDGDGAVEIALVAAADLDYPNLRSTFSSNDLQCWLIVVDGRSGRIRWKTPLSSAYGSSAPPNAQLPPAGSTNFPVQIHNTRLLNIADLDGDGTLDVVTPAIAQSGRNLEIRAFRGTSGEAMWTHSLPPEWQMANAFLRQTWVRVCDVDQDGKADVVFVDRDQGAETLPTFHFMLRLNSLSGATGVIQWQRDIGPSPFEEPFLKGERRGVSEFVLARTSIGGVAPTVLITGSESKIVSVQGKGDLFETSLSKNLESGTLWCLDIDGNGVDELAYLLHGELKVVSPSDATNAKWKEQSKSSRYVRILEARGATNDQAGEIVAIRTLGDNSVVGLDAATGKENWVVAAPIPRDRRNYVSPQTITRLNIDPRSRTPLVFFQYNQVSHNRLAFQYGDKSVGLGKSLSKVTKSESKILAARDPRLARGLPWELNLGRLSTIFETVLNSFMYGIAIILLPAAYLGWLIKYRRWGLRTLLMLPAIIAFAILIATKNLFGFSELTTMERCMHGFLASPPLIMTAIVGVWIVQKRWQRILFWGGIALAVTVIFALAGLISDIRMNPFQPGEYYVLDEWYLIFDVSTYATSIFLSTNWISRIWAKEAKARE